MASQEAPHKLVEEYYEMVTEGLHELAWCNNYPINPNIGVHCFLEAFKRQGIGVQIGKDRATFTTLRESAGKVRYLECTMTFEEIVAGWPHAVKATPRAFYDSICETFDRMTGLKLNYRDRDKRFNREEINQLDNFRNSESKEVRKKMEYEFLGYFGKYQEHMLLPVSRKVPKFDKPKIFSRVVEKFPWELLKSAMQFEFGKDCFCSPCVETLVREYPDFDPGNFPQDFLYSSADTHHLGPVMIEGYHPSTRVLDELFFGMYMTKLVKEKRYSLRYPTKNKRQRLAELSASPFNSLKQGYEIF